MREQECWRAVVDLPEGMSLGELHGIMRDLGERRSLTVQFFAAHRRLILFLHETDHLSGAPSGTHDFARGWLAHEAAAAAARYLKPLDWEPVKWYPDGRVIPDSSSIRSGFRL